MSEPTSDTSDREIVFERLLNAPRELVFAVWTEPRHLIQWWGPDGFSNTFHEIDVRPGGMWRFVMHGPDGREYQNLIAYEEVVKPERLVYTHRGESGEDVHFRSVVAFEDKNGKTLVTLKIVFPSKEALEHVVKEHHADKGGQQTMTKMADHVAGLLGEKPMFRITRVFDAPRNLVWQAWTQPERLAQWWGPKGFTWKGGTVDLRPGGVFHYGMSAPNGMTMWGRFVYRDLAAPERLAFVVSFSDETGGITRHPMSATWPLQVLNVITFTESGGKTAMIIEGGPVAATPEEIATFAGAREMVQKGFDGTMEQLNAHLAQAQGKQ